MNKKKDQEIKYPYLFSPLQIGQYMLKNRIIALPVHTGFPYPDGRVSSMLIEFTRRIAASGAAMVIVANAAVSLDGVVSKFNLRIDRDEFIPGLARLARVIKQNGAAACLQLNHAGRFAKTDKPLLPSPIDTSNLSFNVLSLKGFMEFFPLEKRFPLTRYFLRQLNTWRRAMSSEDRERIIADFGDAAFRAFQAGFDMVELHGANGYLLCQFLSPFTNKIQSGFGGDFQGRTAFPLAVIREIKKRIPEFPVGFRLILREWVPGGIDFPEALAFARLLEKEDIAYISASAGSYNSIFSESVMKKMAKPGYLREDMAKLTKTVKTPTIISGRVITPALGDKLIKNRTASLIGLGRPLRTDPRWIKKAKGYGGNIITCINCNWCIKRVVLEQGFNCRRWPELFQERTELEHKLLTRNYRGLWAASSVNDLKIFKDSLSLLLPDIRNISAPILPTLLFLRKDEKNKAFDSAQKDFGRWLRNSLDNMGLNDAAVNTVVRPVKKSLEKEVSDEIAQGGHGLIFIASDRNQLWQERILYKERGKVTALISPNPRQHKVAVPIDLSPVTLLIMMFLRQTHMGKTGFDFTFIHVHKDNENFVEQRWNALKKTAGLDENIPLQHIPLKEDVGASLIQAVQEGEYGTIIMGKRGLSGIKLWLMGSVSARVLRSLKDQSLFLID